MFWNRPARKQPEPEPEPGKQLLYYAQAELQGDLFAVIRVRWNEKGMPIFVAESQIIGSDDEAIPEFSQIVRNALMNGADVSIICSEPPEVVGIERQ